MKSAPPKDSAATSAPSESVSLGAVAKFQPPRLPYHDAIEREYGVTRGAWKALVEAVYPLAQSVDSIVMALSYCKARNLDVFKHPVHIVPIWDKVKKRMVDTIWAGIGELRVTASRTKQYAGADAAEFGPMADTTFTAESDEGARRQVVVRHPEWCQLTVYRLIDGQRVPVPGPRVYWKETYSRQGRSEMPNDMWQKRPIGQLEKCAEAAALRRAFPEEIGDDHIVEEATGGTETAKDITPPRPTRADAPELPPAAIVDEDGVVLQYADEGPQAESENPAPRNAEPPSPIGKKGKEWDRALAGWSAWLRSELPAMATPEDRQALIDSRPKEWADLMQFRRSEADAALALIRP